jgi:hypothetical protein
MKRLAPPAVLAFTLLLSSCATSPGVIAPVSGPAGEFALLDGGGQAYFLADVPAARPILDRAEFGGVSGSQARDLLDLTRVAAIGVYAASIPAPGSALLPAERRFHIAAWGAYPSSRAGFGMAFSPHWKKVKSPAGQKYWQSQREGLALYLNSRFALLSNIDPFTRSPEPVSPPDSLASLRPGAALAGWVRDPAIPLNSFMDRLGIPIQIPAEQLVFAVYPVPEPASVEPPAEARFTAALRLETPSAAQARGLASMFNTVRNFASRAAETAEGLTALALVLLAAPPEPDGNALILRTGPLTASQIAALFNVRALLSETIPVY